MFENLQVSDVEKQSNSRRKKEGRNCYHSTKKAGNIFQHLPSSVLQASYFSSIVEALIGKDSFSGIIEVYTPERGTAFFPKINLGGSSDLIGFIFLPVNVELFHYQSLRKEIAVPFLWCTGQLIVLFCDLLAFWKFWSRWLLPRPWFPTVATVLGIFLGFIQRSDPKNIGNSMNRSTWASKALQVLVQAWMDTGRYLVFGCFASLVQVYVPTRILTSISATPVIATLLHGLTPFTL